MNFNQIKFATIILFTILVSACSSEDNDDNIMPNNETQNQNEVIINGTSYALTTAWINDENTTNNNPSDIGFNFFNKTTEEIMSGADLSSLTHVYFDFSEIDLQETTYTNILDYDVTTNGTILNGEFNPGTVFLSDNDSNSDLYAASSSVTINALTDTTVDLTFSFTRNDGQVISGSFSGNYIDPN